MSFFNKISDKLSSTGKDVAKKTKDLAEIAKLNMRINSEENNIKNLYNKIGELYYELFHDCPHEKLAPLCASVTESKKKISDYQNQIQAIKAVKKCVNCGAEIYDSAIYCSNCGFNNAAVENQKQEQDQGSEAENKCTNCGETVPANAIFCGKCGTKVK
ncbi:MAG TPA: zinc ribbon domain-containing protein [Clostridiaceae bacterium]|nr:zinc ribbon domain-containing protein [Clostridiaceae bacterium]